MTNEQTHHRAEVAAIDHVKTQYLTLSLTVGEDFRPQAGQYTAFQLEDADGSFPAYYSIASVKRAGQIEFCIIPSQNPRLAAFYDNLKVGDEIKLITPQTAKFKMDLIEGPSIFIAGGSGVAPLRAMIQELQHREFPHSSALIYGCRDGDAIPFIREFTEMSQSFPQFQAHFCAENSNGEAQVKAGKVTDLIPDVNIPDARYFLCGPPPMVKAVKDQLKEQGIDESVIFVEGH